MRGKQRAVPTSMKELLPMERVVARRSVRRVRRRQGEEKRCEAVVEARREGGGQNRGSGMRERRGRELEERRRCTTGVTGKGSHSNSGGAEGGIWNEPVCQRCSPSGCLLRIRDTSSRPNHTCKICRQRLRAVADAPDLMPSSNRGGEGDRTQRVVLDDSAGAAGTLESPRHRLSRWGRLPL